MHAQKTGFVVEHDFIMVNKKKKKIHLKILIFPNKTNNNNKTKATYLADRVVVYTGTVI